MTVVERLESSPHAPRTRARRLARRWGVAGVALAVAAPIAAAAAPADASRGGDHHRRPAFRQVNLVSDLHSVHAKIVDRNVKNPWGIALGPDTPLWVNNNFNPASDCGSPNCVPTPASLLTKITVYRGANGHEPVSSVPLKVTASSPFGMVYNPTSSFVVKQGGVRAPARFIFNELVLKGQAPVAEITGWSNASRPTPTSTVTKAKKEGSVQLGLALVPGDDGYGREARRSHGSGPHLLAADGATGAIDVYDAAFHPVRLRGSFTDPRQAAEGLSPYNVTYLRGRVYVTYTSEGDHSAVSVFSTDGRFLRRLVSDRPLAAPWGMTIAPRSWGRFAAALLVGNVADGKINAFDRRSGHLLGTVSDATGRPLVNPGLWGLVFGNGVMGTPDTLLFAAGIGSGPGGGGGDEYEHGLVGLIAPVHDRR